ncbi:diacylglycerol kinase family protein [Massilia sp. B-10]|nr:diacylglycerol kinase family protein [Massilia sp. B-10]
MLRTQHNAWLHAVATVAVITLAVLVDVSASDWRWLIAAMATVWVAETINTAVEYVCDVVSPGYHEAVKRAKDIAMRWRAAGRPGGSDDRPAHFLAVFPLKTAQNCTGSRPPRWRVV